MSDFDSRAIKGVAWSFVERWGRLATSLLVFALLARLLSPEDFGLLASAMVFTAGLQLFRDQGLKQAVIQREELDEAGRSTAFWAITVTGGLLTLLGVLLAPLATLLIDETGLVPVLRWLSLVLVLSALGGTHDALLRRDLEFRAVAIRSMLGIVVGGGVGVAMALGGYGVWSLVGKTLVGAVTETVALWVLSDWRPALTFRWDTFKDLYRFGVNILGSNVMGYLNKRADDLFIGSMLGATSLGYYTVGYKIVGRIKSLIGTALNQAAFPTLSRLQDDPERMRNSFYRAAQLSIFIAGPLFAGCLVMSEELITVVFSDKWAPSAPVLKVLSLAAVAHVLDYLNFSMLLAHGRARLKLLLSGSYAVLNLAIFWYFSRFDIYAVALAFTVRSYATMPASYWVVRAVGGISLRRYGRYLAAPVVAAGVMAVSVWAIAQRYFVALDPLPRLSAGAVLGAILYAATVWLLDRSLLHRGLRYYRLLMS